VHISIPWLKDRPEAYQALCKPCASKEFIAKSIKAQESRGSGGSGHTYGPDWHMRMSKHMVRKIITKMHSLFLFCY
jgi:NADH:ubiquinone oxidoreductase subunit F (NADH-binding)